MKIIIWRTEIFDNAAGGKSLRVYYEAKAKGWSRKSEEIFPLHKVRGNDLLEWIYSTLTECTWNTYNAYKIYEMKEADEISGRKEVPELKRLRKTVPQVYWLKKESEIGKEE